MAMRLSLTDGQAKLVRAIAENAKVQVYINDEQRNALEGVRLQIQLKLNKQASAKKLMAKLGMKGK